MGLVDVRACSKSSFDAFEYAEVVVFDHDGDDGPGVCSSDSQSLAGDYHDAVFGNSPLHTLGTAGGGEGSAVAADRAPRIG